MIGKAVFLFSLFIYSSAQNNSTSSNSTENVLPAQSNNSTTITDADETTTKLPTTIPMTTKKLPPPTRSSVKLKFIQKTNQGNIDYASFVGSIFKFDCRVETTDGSDLVPPKMYWYKDNVPIQEISYRSFPREGLENVYTLELRNLMKADSGKYKCTADNQFNKELTHTVALKVNDNPYYEKPSILAFHPINPTVIEGDKVQFYCAAKKIKDQTPMIQWIKYSQRPYVPPPPPKNITTNTTVKPEEKIVGNQSVATIASKVTTTVQPATTTESPDKTLSENFLALEQVSNISFVMNDTIFEEKSLKLEQEDESYLTIEKADLHDTAEYTCVIFNQNGFAKNTTRLIVKPVPPKSINELETDYFNKYGKKTTLKFPLTVLIGLPVFLLILLIIGCVWWRENEARRGDKYEKLKKQVSMAAPVSDIEQIKHEEKKPSLIPDIFIVPDTTDNDDVITINSSRPSIHQSHSSIVDDVTKPIVHDDVIHLSEHDDMEQK